MNRRTVRTPDDNGRTRNRWASLEAAYWSVRETDFMSFIERTGEPVGRPRKAYDQLTRTGKIMRRRADLAPVLTVDIDCSGPDDWAKERREREEALERVRIAAIKGRGNA